MWIRDMGQKPSRPVHRFDGTGSSACHMVPGPSKSYDFEAAYRFGHWRVAEDDAEHCKVCARVPPLVR